MVFDGIQWHSLVFDCLFVCLLVLFVCWFVCFLSILIYVYSTVEWYNILKAFYKWMDGMGWIDLRVVIGIEHLTVLINRVTRITRLI